MFRGLSRLRPDDQGLIPVETGCSGVSPAVPGCAGMVWLSLDGTGSTGRADQVFMAFEMKKAAGRSRQL